MKLSDYGSFTTGKPDTIVSNLLSENLQTEKAIKTDPTLFQVRFHPGKKTPFAIIKGLLAKSVAQDSKNKTSESSGGAGDVGVGGVADIDSGSYGKMSGSAGTYSMRTMMGITLILLTD